MKNSPAVVLVLTTAPDLESARKIAKTLLEEKLAACVSILPGLSSLYYWQGELQDDREVQLLIKSREDLLREKVVPRIQQLHPYDLPEILALPVLGGSEPYQDWVRTVTNQEPDHRPGFPPTNPNPGG